MAPGTLVPPVTHVTTDPTSSFAFALLAFVLAFVLSFALLATFVLALAFLSSSFVSFVVVVPPWHCRKSFAILTFALAFALSFAVPAFLPSFHIVHLHWCWLVCCVGVAAAALACTNLLENRFSRPCTRGLLIEQKRLSDISIAC